MFFLCGGGVWFFKRSIESIFSVSHEDGNGEKLTVKKWWLFGC